MTSNSTGSDAQTATSTASQELLDEVFALVGRNLLVCQQAESYLKALLANSCIEATAEGFTSTHEQRRASVQKQTLGQLAAGVLKDLLADAGVAATDDAALAVAAPTIRTSFRISLASGEDLAAWAGKLRSFVEERNELVHHFLERYTLRDDESARHAIAHLKSQRECIAPVRDVFRQWLETMGAAQRQLAKYFTSPDVVDLFILQASSIVTHLATAAQTHQRTDGWTLLSTAANFLVREAPEELSNMKQRYGHATLKRLVMATELFDVRDEPLPFGTRALYRVKPELFESDVSA